MRQLTRGRTKFDQLNSSLKYDLFYINRSLLLISSKDGVISENFDKPLIDGPFASYDLMVSGHETNIVLMKTNDQSITIEKWKLDLRLKQKQASKVMQGWFMSDFGVAKGQAS